MVDGEHKFVMHYAADKIARALGITVGTVKLHTHAILRATGTRNRTEVALIAGRFLAPIVEA